jgi:hypothetical protein
LAFKKGVVAKVLSGLLLPVEAGGIEEEGRKEPGAHQEVERESKQAVGRAAALKAAVRVPHNEQQQKLQPARIAQAVRQTASQGSDLTTFRETLWSRWQSLFPCNFFDSSEMLAQSVEL